jgi:molybdopterin converting factor small subunit
MSLEGDQLPHTDQESPALDKEEIVKTNNRIIKAVKENIVKAQKRQKEIYDKKTTEIKYNVGDIVNRLNHKLSSKAKKYSQKLGPKYIRTEIIAVDGDTYTTKDVDGKIGVRHANQLKPAPNVVTRSSTKPVQVLISE